jgi:hypothetical protein
MKSSFLDKLAAHGPVLLGVRAGTDLDGPSKTDLNLHRT